ncbi:hexose kinase [Pseudarthrobacter sp. J75]|uniref:1-phosphofructokinase family hexose kinase n=1 Tax=unclassified Pseudarthrobacter TaxID=2647000 RepID=UPI002E803039|nr:MULTISPECIES: hexose kinase [unclassified Pseudarthrobacter]MEE2521728.1 hexose kinase [Pseudarthrobacter sp. J47]MEE2527805.1 hexose kinase [Pseudarthrobacter sp. J75]MEE2569373.1 hexose kinase [Pseudarthrobacter sp. J64]
MTRIITVTPNPAVDVTYHVAGVTPGGSHRVQSPQSRAGGKGINVARVAHQLGHSVLAIAPCGGSAGVEFATEIAASGVPHRLVPVEAPMRRSVAVVDTASGQTTIFNEAGAPLQQEDWRALAAAVVESLGADDGQLPGALVGSGSLPPVAPADFYPSLVALARMAGVPAVIDTSGPGILAAASAGADLLKPNSDELLEATGEANRVLAARQLLALGARRVLVSAGEEGMLLFDAASPGHCLTARLPEPLAGNPTGAGDAAVAAAAVALAAHSDAASLLRAATAWSAAAVLMPAAGEVSASYAELESQLVLSRKDIA